METYISKGTENCVFKGQVHFECVFDSGSANSLSFGTCFLFPSLSFLFIP